MDLPDKIITAADAAQLLDVYRDVDRSPSVAPWAEYDYGPAGRSIVEAHERVRDVLHGLDRDPGPGPGVLSARHGLIGEPQPRTYAALSIVEPELTPYGVIVDQPTAQLAALVADIAIVRALAARCERCSAVERGSRRARQADRWQREADALIAYAADLEQQLIEPLSAPVLDELRAQLARRAPELPDKPVPRPVQLR